MEAFYSVRGFFLGAVFAALTLAVFMPATAQAGIVGTQELVQEQQSNVDRAQLLEALDRSEIRAELERYGVDADQAQDRVAAMTDAEVLELSAGIDQFAAGGDIGVATLLLLIILFILVT